MVLWQLLRAAAALQAPQGPPEARGVQALTRPVQTCQEQVVAAAPDPRPSHLLAEPAAPAVLQEAVAVRAAQGVALTARRGAEQAAPGGRG